MHAKQAAVLHTFLTVWRLGGTDVKRLHVTRLHVILMGDGVAVCLHS